MAILRSHIGKRRRCDDLMCQAFPMVLVERPVMLANSPALRVAGANWVSVVTKLPLTGVACSVVRNNVAPFASVPDAAAELLQVVAAPVRIDAKIDRLTWRDEAGAARDQLL